MVRLHGEAMIKGDWVLTWLLTLMILVLYIHETRPGIMVLFSPSGLSCLSWLPASPEPTHQGGGPSYQG